MIKINRTQCPNSLMKANHLIRENDYKKPDVKQELLKMQHFKCCYCERDLSIVSDTEREVEHYFPRDYYKDNNDNIIWHLANSWNNLMAACRKCNNDKRTQIPRNETTGEIFILNPSDTGIDPEDHIDFIIDDETRYITYCPKNGSLEGKSTIEKLKFGERIDLIANLIFLKCDIDKMFSVLLISTINDQHQKIKDTIDDIKKLMSAHSCHASFSRKYIKKCQDDFNNKIIPHIYKIYNKTIPPLNINILMGYDKFPQ